MAGSRCSNQVIRSLFSYVPSFSSFPPLACSAFLSVGLIQGRPTVLMGFTSTISQVYGPAFNSADSQESPLLPGGSGRGATIYFHWLPEFMLFVEGNPVWLMSKLTRPLPLMGVSPLRYSGGVVLKRKWVTWEKCSEFWVVHKSTDSNIKHWGAPRDVWRSGCGSGTALPPYARPRTSMEEGPRWQLLRR